MDWKSRLSASIFLLWGTLAFAVERPSCLPEFNSLQAILQLDLSTDSARGFQLKSDNASGVFITKVVMDYVYSAQTQTLNMKFHFEDSFDGVSLPYNVFAILVLQNGTLVAWYDYTKACQTLGPGIYPGQSFSPLPVKLSGSGRQPLQFIVWGRIN